MPSELCTPTSGRTGSVAAAAGPMVAVGAESIRRAGHSREGGGSRGRRGSHAVATGCLAGGATGFGRLKPYSTAGLGEPAAAAWRRRVLVEMTSDGTREGGRA